VGVGWVAAAVVRTGRFCAQAAIGDDLHAVALQQTCTRPYHTPIQRDQLKMKRNYKIKYKYSKK
jgi:hypothetical protein